MANDFNEMEFDPVTGTTKTKKKQQPYLNSNEASQGMLPYTGQDYTEADTKQGNTNVLGAAQNAALSQPANTAIQDQTTAMTQKLMTDPNMGRDWSKYNAGQMSKFDADRSSGVKEFKESNTGMGGAGQVQDQLVKLALQQNLDRGTFENDLEQQAYEESQQNYIDALGQGREQGDFLTDSQNSYINNLGAVRGMAEGGENREAATTAQANSQAWQTSERISTEDYTASQNNLDRILQQAIKDQDVGQQQWAINKQGELQLKMQTNDMTQEEKMAYLDDQLAGAQADKDVGRQKQILSYQTDLKLKEMEKQAGYETALTTLKGDIDKAIASGNTDAASALQEAELKYRAGRDTQDFALQAAAQELEAKGVNMEVIDTQYGQILEAYGQEAADEFISRTLQTQGVDMSKYQIADKQAQAEKALLAEFDVMKTQFGQTHPEAVDPATGDLTPAGMQTFNEYYNETMYGEESEATKEARRTAGWITDPLELSTVMPGDKIKLDKDFSLNVSQTGSKDKLGGGHNIAADSTTKIPAGEYSVVQEKATTGEKFWGTERTTTKTYVVGLDGKKYLVANNRGGTVGNIVSNLWAGD